MIIDDNDYLEFSELDRHIIMKERLDNYDIKEETRSEHNQNYWKKNYSGTRIFPPKSSGTIFPSFATNKFP